VVFEAANYKVDYESANSKVFHENVNREVDSKSANRKVFYKSQPTGWCSMRIPTRGWTTSDQGGLGHGTWIG
jgi:hypothetical protein